MIESALQHILATDTGVSALVDDRVDWGARPKGDDVPCLVHTCRLVEPASLGGFGGSCTATVELIGLANDAQTAAAVADAALAALQDISTPTLIASTGVTVGRCIERTRETDIPLAVNGEERGVCEVRYTVMVPFSE